MSCDINPLQLSKFGTKHDNPHPWISPRTWSEWWTVTKGTRGGHLGSLSFKQLHLWSVSSQSNSLPVHEAPKEPVAKLDSPSSSCWFSSGHGVAWLHCSSHRALLCH